MATKFVPRDWAKLEGVDVHVAERELQSAFPTMNILIVPYGNAVTADYRFDRIRIWEKDGKVVGTPKLG